MKTYPIQTPLGPLLARANDEALYSLQFVDTKETPNTFISNPIIDSIRQELDQYFEGKLKQFKTPLFLSGTSFQIAVWNELRKIPYAKTISYLTLAKAIQNPKAYRAAAQANGANSLPIIIPCHRVIYLDGTLGGYSSGLERKKWLLEHERAHGPT
jgi:AraC family transcriptional regulator of adaptative response/methylated-DNA-[protein]-cysteine methyltransferase